MRNKYFKLFLILIMSSIFSSCMVSKKKYTALESKMNRKQDSLNTIISDNQKDFNAFMNKAQLNETYKVELIDSLSNQISELTSNTLDLKMSLKNAIAEYDLEKEKLKKLSNDVELKTAEVETLKKELEQSKEELISLQKMIENNKKETENLKNIIDEALNSFDASELTVYEKNGKVYVSLEEKLLFKTGSAKIDKKGENAIIKVAKVLEKNKDISILIEGHTDNVGASDVNWKLSADRALAVVKIFEDNSNIDLSRITVAGRGMYSPVASNKSDEGKKKNRRIEIILTPNLETLYKIFEETP